MLLKNVEPYPIKQLTGEEAEKARIAFEEAKSNGKIYGIFDLFDHTIMTTFKLNDEQYDYICEHATDEELELILNAEDINFAKKRKIVTMIKKYKALHANNSTEFDF